MLSKSVFLAGVFLLIGAATASATTTIIAVHSGLCLDINGQSTSAGALSIQNTCDSATYRQWEFISVGGGYYNIQNQNSLKCLRPANGSSSSGANIEQVTCYSSANNQKYSLTLVNSSTDQYHLVNKANNLCFAISGDSLSTGANLIQTTCGSGANLTFMTTTNNSSTYFVDDNFSGYSTGTCLSDGTTFGPWTDVFGGGGCTKITTVGSNNVLELSPTAAGSSGNTYSSLTKLFSTSGDIYVSVNLKTVQQLRTTPNPWEVGWVLWNYTDNNHFYYFIPKTNGWELGKETLVNGVQTQVFLATGSSPTYPINNSYTVEIQQVGSTITVWVNGTQVTSYTDSGGYTSGSVAVYTEDAKVDFYNITATAP